MASKWSRHIYAPTLIQRNGSPATGASLPLAAIVGIVVGISLVVLSISGALIVIYHLRRQHRRQGRQIVQTNEHGHVDMDIKSALRSTQPPEISFSRRLSSNPFLPLRDADVAQEWADHNVPQEPVKAKRSASQRSFFRVPAVRGSWPLASSNLIPLAILPNQSTMVLSPVAPPGYVIEDRGPNRSSSRLSRRKSAISVDTTRPISPKVTKRRGSADSSPSQSPAKSPKRSPRRSPARETLGAPPVMPHKPQRRATSETQFSTILRSTSLRLKAAHRQSLQRTMTTIGKFPGMPPPDRLPTPPRGLATESRVELIEKDYAESVRSSVFDCYTTHTPSPGKEIELTFEEPPVKPMSPTPSSGDSLCETTPEVTIPAPLTSPSKNLRSPRGEKRHSRRISSAGNAGDIPSTNVKDTTATKSTATEFKIQIDKKGLDLPHHISLASDPFYSSVRGSKPIIPHSRVQGPRPMCFRKATFGHETTSDRPASFCSPLRESTGNVQLMPKKQDTSPPSSPTRSPDRDSIEPNPFQWSPEEARKMRANSTSPKHPSSRRRGHKRSNVVRISGLMASSRPPSIVEAVDEEDNTQPKLKFNVPQSSGRISVPPKSPSPSPSGLSGRRSSLRPLSSLKFEPTFIVPELVPRSLSMSPTLGLVDNRSSGIYSPTLSMCNFYTEQKGESEDELFNTRPLTLTKRPASVQSHPEACIQSRNSLRHQRNYSIDLPLYPGEKSERDENSRLISFPPLRLADRPTPILSPPPSGLRPLPNITSTMTGPATPAPPLLTTLLPSQLALGSRPSETAQSGRRGTSPPRNSLHASINLLRRMNSDVSQYSNFSAPSTEVSPTFSSFPSRPSHFPNSSLSQASTLVGIKEAGPESPERERGRSRGSRHYLALGSQESFPTHIMPSMPDIAKMPVPKADRRDHSRPRQPRDSHRVHKERRRKRHAAEPEADVDSDNYATPRKYRRGGRGMEWEFDDDDRGSGGMSDWDTELTPVKEVSTPPDANGRQQSNETDSNGNALGIMGLRYPTLRYETDQSDLQYVIFS